MNKMLAIGSVLAVVALAQCSQRSQSVVRHPERVLLDLIRGYSALSDHKKITDRLLVELGVARTAPTIVGYPGFRLADGIRPGEVLERFSVHHPIATSVWIDAEKGRRLVEALTERFARK